MTFPRVSVVLPSFNHEAFVEEAMRSVFRQEWPELELVVVDDGSTDDSRKVIARVLRDAGRVEVVYEEQENAGAHAALERGIALSTGQVIALLNSDDYFDEARLLRLRPHFCADQDFLIFSGVCLVDGKGREVAPRTDLARWYQLALRQAAQCPTVGHALLCNNIAVTSGNLVFSRSLYQRAGGFGPYRFCPDWDFILRCTRLVEPVFVPDKLHYYRLHESNTIDAASVAALDEEYGRILTDYLARSEREPAQNPLAPGRANWPVYWPYFARTHTRFNSRRIAELVLDPALVAFPEAAARWHPWTGGVLELLERDDLGHFAANGSAARPPELRSLESLVLLRELALVRQGLHERYPDFAPSHLTDLELVQSWNEWARSLKARAAP